MKKDCSACGYNLGSECKVMKEKQTDCFAWADAKEIEKREEAISKYYRSSDKEIVKKSYKNERNGKKTKDILDKRFMKLYEMGLFDYQIGHKLKISASVVTTYRNSLNLKSYKKRGLLAQANKK